MNEYQRHKMAYKLLNMGMEENPELREMAVTYLLQTPEMPRVRALRTAAGLVRESDPHRAIAIYKTAAGEEQNPEARTSIIEGAANLAKRCRMYEKAAGLYRQIGDTKEEVKASHNLRNAVYALSRRPLAGFVPMEPQPAYC